MKEKNVNKLISPTVDVLNQTGLRPPPFSVELTFLKHFGDVC